MTQEETAQLLAMMKAIWPNHPTPEPAAMVMAYWMGLDDVAADAVTQAFTVHMKDPQRGRFFPTVADLRGVLPPMPMIPALASGEQATRPERCILRLYDADLDTYVDLTEPVPFGDPRCPALIEQDRANIRLAGARRRGEAA